MRACPVCGGEAGVLDNDGMVGCRACQVFAPPAAWDALPRVRADAEALVEEFSRAFRLQGRTLYERSEEEQRSDVAAARAELLRACVVETQKPCCPDAGHPTDCCKAPMPPITVDVLLGVLRAPYQPNPHAVLWDESDLRRAFSKLCVVAPTPPVPDDADALLDALEETVSVRGEWDSRAQDANNAARAAVRARMRPWPTAEALHSALVRCSTETCECINLETVRAALGGGK